MHMYTHIHISTYKYLCDLRNKKPIDIFINSLGKETVCIWIQLLLLLKTILYFSQYDIRISALL